MTQLLSNDLVSFERYGYTTIGITIAGEDPMHCPTLVILAAVLAFSADEPRSDLDKLQGFWILVSREFEGMKTQSPKEVGFKVTFHGNKVTVEQQGMTFPLGTFELDPKLEPKSYDRKLLNGKTGKGIYKLDGHELKICLAAPGDNRPTEFSTKPGDGRSLVTVHAPSGRIDGLRE